MCVVFAHPFEVLVVLLDGIRLLYMLCHQIKDYCVFDLFAWATKIAIETPLLSKPQRNFCACGKWQKY